MEKVLFKFLVYYTTYSNDDVHTSFYCCRCYRCFNSKLHRLAYLLHHNSIALSFHQTFNKQNENLACQSTSLLVIHQRYDLEVQNPGGFIGSNVIIKCNIPQFVKDYVKVTSWLEEPMHNIYPSSEGGELF